MFPCLSFYRLEWSQKDCEKLKEKIREKVSKTQGINIKLFLTVLDNSKNLFFFLDN